VGFGVLIINMDGSWLVGFTGFAGINSKLFPELLAIKHGQTVA